MKKSLYIFLAIIAISSQLFSQNCQLAPTHFEPIGQKANQIIKPAQQQWMPKQSNPYCSASKTAFNYLDTLYKVRYNTDFFDIIEDSGFYYLVGHNGNMTSSTWDSINHTILLRMKISYDGSIIWTKEDSLANGYQFCQYNHSIIKLADGNFLAMGNLNNDFKKPKNYDSKLPIYIKFKSNGDTIWRKLIADTVGRKFGFWPQDIIADNDGGFTVAGLLGSQTRTWNAQDQLWYHDTTYITIIKYDSFGNEVKRQQHYVGGYGRTPGVDGLLRLNDGSYMIYGTNYFNFPASSLKKNYVFHLDSNFNYIEVKTFGQMIPEFLIQNNIIPSKYGGYNFAVSRADTPMVVIGSETYYTYYHQTGFMNDSFEITKDTIYILDILNQPGLAPNKGRGFVMGLEETKDGDIVIAAIVCDGTQIFQMDTNLNIKWTNYIWYFHNKWQHEWTLNMRPASDGGFLIVGFSLYGGAWGWLVKTDTMGFALPNGGDTLIHVGINPITKGESKSQEIKIYPNPFNNHLTLELQESIEDAEVFLYDIVGKQIMRTKISGLKARLNTSGLEKGIYLVKLVHGKEKFVVGKVVRE